MRRALSAKNILLATLYPIRKGRLTSAMYAAGRLTGSTTSHFSLGASVSLNANVHSDVLQKHIKGHTAKQEAAERNKRACHPCHRAKTRCAGGLPCQSCLKRRIQCILETPSNGTINPQGSNGSALQQGNSTKDYKNSVGRVSSASNIESSQYRYGSVGSIHVEPPFFKVERNNSINSAPMNVTSRVEMNSQIVNVSNSIHAIKTTIQFDANWQFVPPIAPTAPQPNYMNRAYANPINTEAVEYPELYFSHFHPR